MAKITIFTTAPGKNDIPVIPYVSIQLSESTGDNDDEIDWHVNDLIEQLEKARKKAKSELKKAKEQVRNILKISK